MKKSTTKLKIVKRKPWFNNEEEFMKQREQRKNRNNSFFVFKHNWFNF